MMTLFTINMVRYVKAYYFYIVDGADKRTPPLVAFYMIYLIGVVVSVRQVLSNDFNQATSLAFQVASLFLVAQLLRGRLYSFPNIRITRAKRNLIGWIVGLLLTFAIVFSIFFLDETKHLKLELRNYKWVDDFFEGFISTGSYEGRYNAVVSLPIIIAGFLLSALNLWFDCVELRSKRTKVYDSLLFVIFIVFALFSIKGNHHFSDVVDGIISVVGLVVVQIITFLEMQKEYYSIMKRASGIIPSFNSCRKIIDSISQKKELDDFDRERIKYLRDMLDENPRLREQLTKVENKRRRTTGSMEIRKALS
jgi:hypothetical protein